MKTFTPGQELSDRAIGNCEIIYTAEVIKRTAKTVTIKPQYSDEKRCKIHSNNTEEYIFPDGQYSMCTVFRA